VTATALRPRLGNTEAWRQARIPALLVGAALMAGGVVIAVRLPAADPVSAAILAAIIGIAIWMFSTARYELTLAVVMLYIGLIDGYFKLKTGSQVATLGRDLLLYAIVIGALVRWAIRGERVERPPLTGWVIAWVAVVLIQLANPANGTLGHSMAALRPHLEFVPLFFLGYVVLRSERRLRGFLMLLLVVAAANGIVGLIQFNMTPEELGSWGPGYERKISGEGDVAARGFATEEGELRTRPFALGSDMGFGGIVGIIAVPAALGLLAVGGFGTRMAASLLSIGVILAVVTSQARVAMIGAVVAALGFAALSVTSRGAFRAVMALALAVLVTYASVSVLTSSSDEGAFDRYSSIAPDKAATTTYEYRRATLSRIPDYIKDIPLGAGIGSKGPGGSTGGRGTAGQGLNAESQPSYLLIELGVPGLLVMLGFTLTLVGVSMRRVRKLEQPKLRLLVAAVAAPIVALLATWVVGISTATTPSAPYIWLAAGALSYWLLGRQPDVPVPSPPPPPEPVLAAPRPVQAPPPPPRPLPDPAETAVGPRKRGRLSDLPDRLRQLRRALRRSLG
jgi:O-Antigen ligase